MQAWCDEQTEMLDETTNDPGASRPGAALLPAARPELCCG
jgi:hypothetical protein